MEAGPSGDVIRLLLEVAGAQHSLVATRQLRDLGISEKVQRRLTEQGWLRSVRRGVFAVSSQTRSVWEPAVSALLATGPCGDDAVALSHFTAATIHRLPHLAPRRTVELTAVAPRHPRVPGVLVHRVRQPFGRDVKLIRGMPVTTPARTVVDICSELPETLLARVIDEGCVSRIWTVRDLQQVASRRVGSGRRGIASLQRLLDVRRDRPVADSDLELRLDDMLGPLAPFEAHYAVELDGELLSIDVAWPYWKVGIEADGYQPHARSRLKFDRDRRKANLLLAHGWAIAHVTSTMSDDEILSYVLRLFPRWANVGPASSVG